MSHICKGKYVRCLFPHFIHFDYFSPWGWYLFLHSQPAWEIEKNGWFSFDRNSVWLLQCVVTSSIHILIILFNFNIWIFQCLNLFHVLRFSSLYILEESCKEMTPQMHICFAFSSRVSKVSGIFSTLKERKIRLFFFFSASTRLSDDLLWCLNSTIPLCPMWWEASFILSH